MKDLNDVTLLGNLGVEPAIKEFSNGGAVMRLKIATNRSFKDSQGEWKTLTEWHTVVVKHDQTIERLRQQLRKGSRVLVKGSIETRKYMVDEQERYTTEVIVAGPGAFCADQTPKRQALADTPPDERPPASEPAPRRAARAEEPFEDDIPF